MQALLKNKSLILLFLLLVTGVFLYRTFSTGISDIESMSAREAGKDLLSLSDELSRATLSQDLLANYAYLSLFDLSVPPPSQSFGRKNPFDLLGRE